MERLFSKDELERAKDLSYENWLDNGGDIHFIFNDTHIANPFVDETGRFEFASFEDMCNHYGKDNVVTFIKKILA